ncbi:hypothetical protein [Legionella sp. km772]|uniref:hypothetical protein n=1 Tax=Legionella sp. km772 TaxID=2498111 RepID=UPI000F8E7788|nr:hypothetical protein [Legionella sp. km772]RUR05467.1 hypothetical protein ELY15_14260 [Legionella sp. km772]
MFKSKWLITISFIFVISLVINIYLLRNNISYKLSLNLSSLKDIITIFSICIASYVGLQGLNTWKKSLSGTERHQKAKNLLLDLYTYKDHLYNYRHPAIWAFEYPQFENVNNSSAFRKTTYDDKVFVYQNRLNKVKEYTKKLYVHKLEGKILFGPELDKNIQQIFLLENKVSNEIRNYLENMKEGVKIPYDSKIVYDIGADF